jgi:hypothetical protein
MNLKISASTKNPLPLGQGGVREKTQYIKDPHRGFPHPSLLPEGEGIVVRTGQKKEVTELLPENVMNNHFSSMNSSPQLSGSGFFFTGVAAGIEANIHAQTPNTNDMHKNAMNDSMRKNLIYK